MKGCRWYIGTSWGLSFLFSISSLVLFRVQNDKDGQPQCGNVEMNVIQWKVKHISFRTNLLSLSLSLIHTNIDFSNSKRWLANVFLVSHSIGNRSNVLKTIQIPCCRKRTRQVLVTRFWLICCSFEMPLKLKYDSLEVVYPEYDISTTHQSLWMSRNALHINRYLRCSIWKTLPIVHWRQKMSGVIAMTILYAPGKKGILRTAFDFKKFIS